RRHLQGLAGVERALIFGSYASSSDAPDSDIDVLIVGSPDRDDLTDRLESAGREVGRPVNEVVFSEHELRSRRGRGDRFIQSMEQGPVVPLLP
ncbi:MAG: nucleotidyltransferase domain-containing protein, partial [Gemmatimonadota bacterium]